MNHENARPQHAAAVAISSPRDHSLDALRTLAVIGMMAAHTARLVPYDMRPFWARFVLLVEPVIPSLFLLLVGSSLALSFRAAGRRGLTPGAWYRRQLKRAAALWLVSALFFALEVGVRLPDMFLAGGILANIAYAIILVGGILAVAPRIAPTLLVLALAVGTGVFIGLDLAHTRLHPVNIGNSPFLPLWLFALAGAWGQRALVRLGVPRAAPPDGNTTDDTPRAARVNVTALAVTGVVGLVGAGVAAWLITRYGLDALFTKPLGRSDATRIVPAPVYGGEPLEIGYYNLRPRLALACLGLHVAALALLRAATFAADRVTWLFAIGRHALGAYIAHLAVLAALVVALGERQPLKNPGSGTVTWLGLILFCQVLALLRERTNSTLRK